jgi:uncharacterized membrane protein YraQ (UPF0718 family)
MNTAFWYASRATGIVALLLLTAVLVLGILVNRQGPISTATCRCCPWRSSPCTS